MLKRSIAAGCGLLVLSGWPTPASAAATTVSEVKVAWADATHTKVRVSWTESTPVANSLSLDIGGYESRSLGTIAADAPDELLVNTGYLGSTNNAYDVATIVVTDPSGAQASSAVFDRYTPQVMLPTATFTPQGDVRWDAHMDSSDPTPDDPLDVEGGTRYTIRMRLDKPQYTYGHCSVVNLPVTTVPQGVVPNPGQPAMVAILTANEWNPRPQGDDRVYIGGTGLTINGPSATSLGTIVTLTGEVRARYISAGGSPLCEEISYPLSDQRITLQGRNSSTGSWYNISSTKSVADGKYSISLKNPGAREYRAVRADSADTSVVQYGATTAARLVKATTRVQSAKFVVPVVAYGTKAQAYLWVEPPGSQRAALQFRNASGAWQGATTKTLSAGRGIATFGWSRRGVTQFRWWVPASTTATGLRVEPVYTGAFALTVR
jgi:hypothetical protein